MLCKISRRLLLCLILASPQVYSTWAAETTSTRSSVAGNPQSETIEAKYERAVGLFNDNKFPQARAAFEQIWLSAGAYKDTASFLDRIRGGADTSAAAKGNASARKAAAGGQVAPSSPSGGVSSAEQVTRLVDEGRRAFDDAKYDEASASFEQALGIDSGNSEARHYLGQIERVAGTAKFKPSAVSARIAGESGKKSSSKIPDAAEAELLAQAAPAKTSAAKPAVVTPEAHEVGKAAVTTSRSDAPVAFGAVAAVQSAASDANAAAQMFAAPVVIASAKQDTVKASPSKTDEKTAAPLSTPTPKLSDVIKAEAARQSSTKTESAEATKPVPASAKTAEKEVPAAKAAAGALASEASLALNAAKTPVAAPKEVAKPVEAAKPVQSAPAPAPKEVAKPVEAAKPVQSAPAPAPKEVAKPVETAKPVQSAPAPAPKEIAKPVETAKPVQSAPAPAPKEVAKPVEPANSAAPAQSPELRDALNAIRGFADDAAKKAAASNQVIAAAATKAAPKASEVSEKTPDTGKLAREKAAGIANEGIKLFNDSKYDEALQKFNDALGADPKCSDAVAYKAKVEKRLEERRKKQGTPAAAKEKDSAKAKDSKVEKPVADSKPTAKAETKSDASPSAASLPSLDVLKEDAHPKAEAKQGKEPKSKEEKPAVQEASVGSKKESKKESSKAESKKTDPKERADELVRQAQAELKESKKELALEHVKKAAELDPNNVEAKTLAEELQGRKPASKPAADQQAGPKKEEKKEAAASQAPTASKNGKPVGVEGLLAEGKTKLDAGRVEEAVSAFKAVLEIDPNNEVANRSIAQIDEAHKIQQTQGAAIAAGAESDQAEAAFQKGLVAYEAGRLDVAVQWWNYALTINPQQSRALEYLQQTRSEYEAWVQQHQYNAVQLQTEVAGTEKLDSPITYDSEGPKSIVQFLSTMSLLTDISFYVADGVDPEIQVTAKFEDTPLHDAMDIVLLPIGLKWSRNAEVISITPDLRTKFFNLSPEQVTRLKGLLENKTLQRILYGADGTPAMRNVELTLDDRENLLVVTDSQENINKVEAFLKEMQLTGPVGLVYKSWKIRPEEGQKIKALVEAIVKVQSDAPYDLDRKVVVDSDDLIVKDTAENVAKVEQLLLDKNFLRKLESQKLDVATFNLTPRDPLAENIEQVRELAQNVVTVAKTILYSQSTESAANAEGRRYWFDPNTLQLTITDYPENLRVVSDYIRSLPIYGKKQKSDIIFLKHQTASDLNDLLQRVLGLSGDSNAGGGAQTANSVVRTLRVEGELVFRDLRIRITKVNENDVNNKNDDSVEMVVRTPTSSEDRTIEEFRSDFVDVYEINVLEVRPSSTAGEGSVRMEVRYNPAATGVTGVGAAGGGQLAGPASGDQTGPGGVPGAGVAPNATAGAMNESGLQIETIENMNAILIRYNDPGDLAEVRSWIDQLDIPVLQVSIETKLVSVNETRAKRWEPSFEVLNFTHGFPDLRNVTGSTGSFNTALDQFQSPTVPPLNTPNDASFIPAYTSLGMSFGGATPLNFNLKALEAEGVLSTVNGPHVVVENGQTADFEIDGSVASGFNAYQGGNTLGGFGNQTGVGNVNQGNNIGTGGTQNYGTGISQVQMSVSPQITQLGEIRLDIQNLELQDYGPPSGGTVSALNMNTDPTDLTGLAAMPYAITRALAQSTSRRSLQTTARVHNGGTIVLGGWSGEHSSTTDSGVPILRNLPYVGKLFFNTMADNTDKTTLLIFLTCHLVQP